MGAWKFTAVTLWETVFWTWDVIWSSLLKGLESETCQENPAHHFYLQSIYGKNIGVGGQTIFLLQFRLFLLCLFVIVLSIGPVKSGVKCRFHPFTPSRLTPCGTVQDPDASYICQCSGYERPWDLVPHKLQEKLQNLLMQSKLTSSFKIMTDPMNETIPEHYLDPAPLGPANIW